MNFRVALLLWFLNDASGQAVTPEQQCQCGVGKQPRIVGGEVSGANEFTMIAGLVDRRIAQITCGAVLISYQHVLTAAHCVAGMQTYDFAVIVGERDATTIHGVSRFFVHPQFNGYDNDIAIVVTANHIVLSPRVVPACLPFKFNIDLAGRNVTMLGLGTLYPGGPPSVTRKVDVNVISVRSCKARIPSATNKQMCTLTPGKDACQDGSGGPVLFTDPATGIIYSVGIISYGYFCASQDPSINTRVTSYLDWIIKNTPEFNYCKINAD